MSQDQAIKPIWHDATDLDRWLGPCDVAMPAFLGITIDEIGDNFMRGSMPVDERTHQPYGLLHGGASCVLAETLGSMAAAMVVDRERYLVLGQEINANHLRGVREGRVHGVARPDHIGRSSQVWTMRLHDDHQRAVCVSRLTVAVVEQR